MRFGKTSWMILLAGIFVVVIVSLGVTRSQQIKAQSQLTDDLNVATVRMDKLQIQHLHDQQQDLQNQLKTSQQRLEEARDSLREDIESIEVADEFFEIAEKSNVTVMSIGMPGYSEQELEDIVCNSITFNGQVTGELPDIIEFITRLNNEYSTGEVKNARINIEESKLQVQMIAYTYEGD
jgi:hypothetical protein